MGFVTKRSGEVDVQEGERPKRHKSGRGLEGKSTVFFGGN